MRLLLDELYTNEIAQQLRQRGHDVIAVTERSDLTGLSDSELFARMASERRTIVTENWGDFMRELRAAADRDVTHYGLILTSRKRLPRGKNTIGLYVRVLDDFLGGHPDDAALLNSYCWLPEAD